MIGILAKFGFATVIIPVSKEQRNEKCFSLLSLTYNEEVTKTMWPNVTDIQRL